MGIVTAAAGRRLARAALLGVFLLARAVPTQAQHRARLSADLADQLAVAAQAIDVIVHGDRATVDALAARYNVIVTRYLRSGGVLRVNAGQLAALQQDEQVDHLSGDVRLRSSADVTAESIGADQVWAGAEGRPPLSGRGVTVAVIDSGIDTRHSALRQRVVATVDFTGGDGHDGFGHGTHVAGIIAGQVGSTSETSEYRGIAFGASLVNLRVLGDDGSGSASDVVEAIDWAIEHRQQYGIRVVNLSLGAPVLQPYRDDPLCEAVERAVRAGLVVVAAAGNYGQTADGRTVFGAITSPANSPQALTVGALDTHGTPQRSDDTVASFSSRGPTLYDLILKPDVVAPGVHVVSAEAEGSSLATTYPEWHVAGSGASAYMQMSGTSMAAGVVSGAVALLLEERGEAGPPQITTVLQRTSSSSTAGILTECRGSIDVIAALQLLASYFKSATPIQIAGEPLKVNGLVLIQRTVGFHVETTIYLNSPFTESGIPCGETLLWLGRTDIHSAFTARQRRSLILRNRVFLVGNTSTWGSPRAAFQTIIWGSATAPATIIWGSPADAQTIIWGSFSLKAEILHQNLISGR